MNIINLTPVWRIAGCSSGLGRALAARVLRLVPCEYAIDPTRRKLGSAVQKINAGSAAGLAENFSINGAAEAAR